MKTRKVLTGKQLDGACNRLQKWFKKPQPSKGNLQVDPKLVRKF